MPRLDSAGLAALFRRHWDWVLENRPEFASYLGDKRWNDQLTDESLGAIGRRLDETRDWLETFRAVETEELGEQERLSLRLMIQELEYELEDARFEWWLLPINQMDGIHFEVPQMVTFFSFDGPKDYEDLVTRYRNLPGQIDQIIERLEAGVSKGVVQPRFIATIMAGQIESLASADPETSPFASPLTSLPDSMSDQERDDARRELIAAISEAVLPAYGRLARWIREHYEPAGRVDDGIWSLPDGGERYQNRIARSTTTSLMADEIHEIGLSEVARIETEMLEIARSQGHDSIAGYNRALDADPSIKAGVRQRIIDLYEQYTRQMYERLPSLFGRLPIAGLEIRPVEQWREQNEPSASYYNPAPDGSRPGRVMVNTHDAENRKTITMESTAYHEGVPGHHMQLAIQQEVPGLPDFRQQGGHTAYVEGWALYSEALGKEVGFFEDPASDYGRLQDEMLRAIRLVVDTGVHAKRWTREQIVETFRRHSALDEFEIQTEADRYIVWPGQALGYKIGQLKITELRERSRGRLGDGFDIREFHDLVLEAGSLPLDILEERVESWLSSKERRIEG